MHIVWTQGLSYGQHAFKNSEIEQVCAYLQPFYEHGLDAVLVQDFGVLTAIHERFPDLAIHTSTQMTVTGVEAARLFPDTE